MALHRPPVLAAALTLWLARPAAAGERELFFEARYECAARDEALPLRQGQLLMLGVSSLATFEVAVVEEVGERWTQLVAAFSCDHARGDAVWRWPGFPALLDGFKGDSFDGRAFDSLR